MEGYSEMVNYLFNSKRIRKWTVEMVAFNTLQVPFYALAVGAGSFFSEGYINPEKIIDGGLYLAAVSPVTAPLLGWSMNRVRNRMGVGQKER